MTRWRWTRYSVAMALLAGCSNPAGVALISGCTSSQSARVDFRTTASLEGVTTVDVETRNGAIEIRTDPAVPEADIRGTKSAGGITKEEAETNAAEIEIVARTDPARPEVLQIKAVFPGVTNRNQGVSFAITLPPTLKVDLKTANGGIITSGRTEQVLAEASNGPVRLSKVQGNVTAKTTNGPISAEEIEGNLELTSSNGGITLENVRTPLLHARTSNGRIRGSNVEARGPVTLESSNGPIEAELAQLPEQPAVRLHTSNAPINLGLPATVKATLTAGTSNARVHASLGEAKTSDVQSEARSFRATLNGGGGRIEVESSNGPINVKTVPASRPARASLSSRIWKRILG